MCPSPSVGEGRELVAVNGLKTQQKHTEQTATERAYQINSTQNTFKAMTGNNDNETMTRKSADLSR